MRLDKYLKVSRLIKRRTVANEACDAGRVLLNDKVARASAEVKAGDVITIQFGNKDVKVEVLTVQELSLIHISEPTRRTPISYAVFCLKKKKR